MTESITIFGHDGAAGTYTYENGPTTEGTDGDDLVVGGKGDSTVEGSEGNDILIGGSLKEGNGQHTGEYKIIESGGVDTFVFNFKLSQAEGQTFYFRQNEDGKGGDTPNSNANLQAWQNYMDQLAVWREEMEAKYGVKDADTDFTGEAFYTVKKATGSLGGYDNSFTVGGSLEITSSDGHDIILDFGAEDKLALNGLKGISFDEFDALFNVASNGSTTLLSWADGSITIHGLDLVDDAAFYTAATTGEWFL